MPSESIENKAVANGYAPLDSDAALNLTDTSTQSVNHAFIFGPRVNTALGYPVPCIQPINGGVSTHPCALDIAPGALASPDAGNGLAWIDVCSNEVQSQPPAFNGNTLRLGMQGTIAAPTFGEVSTRKYGTNGSIPLYIAADYSGSTQHPQIYLSPMTGTNPNVLVGYDGSDVFIGNSAAPATTAVRGGFLYLNTCAGAPTGVPAQVTAWYSALRYDNTNHKLWVYDSVATAWRGVVLT